MVIDLELKVLYEIARITTRGSCDGSPGLDLYT